MVYLYMKILPFIWKLLKPTLDNKNLQQLCKCIHVIYFSLKWFGLLKVLNLVYKKKNVKYVF